MKRERALAAVLAAGAFLLYARALRYPFVYDDLWRIVTNQSIRHIGNPLRFFTDPSTQSSLPDLHNDSFRPLTILGYAVDYSVFGLNPAGFRAGNVLFHALNGVLVFFLAMTLLALPPPAAFFSAALFIVHPVQTEAVVWIVERTNNLSLFFILCALSCWVLFQRDEKTPAAAGTHVFMILSLLTREIAVVLPGLILLIDMARGYKKRWGHYALAAGEVLAYMLVRSAMTGQVKISPYKGGTLASNLGNVARIWPLYWRVALWPAHLRATYSDIEPVTSILAGPAVLGWSALLLFGAAFVWSWRKAPRAAVALGTIFLFWLPGSNIIPLMTLFGERLLYPAMIGFCWLAGLLFEQVSSKKPARAAAVGLIVLLGGLTWRHLPVWSSELALWENAATVAPKAWFAWACYGNELHGAADRVAKTDPAAARPWYEKSENALEQALRNGPDPGSAARLLVLSAQDKHRLGKSAEAAELAKKGIALDPSLARPWEAFLRSAK